MSEKKTSSVKKGKKNKIFISWSGENSKEIAREIKKIFEDVIFQGTELTCFVSDIDIASGADWWNKIKGELMSCKLGILCVTKENIKAPWVYFEAGAMVARDVPTIPLIINCNISSLDGSPLKGKQCVDFYDQQKFMKMIADINNQMSLLSMPRQQLDLISKYGHEQLKTNLSPVLKQLKNMRIFNEKYIYPSHITTVKTNTVFISAPMASIDDSEYADLRTYLITLKDILINIGFSDVRCPLFDKNTKASFDGKTKAIKDNFANLKQMDSMLVIYPRKIPSSTLVEIGYGIALCKRLVIFHSDGLPYILEEAGETIKHIKTFKYQDYSYISETIKSNGMDLFEGENDE